MIDEDQDDGGSRATFICACCYRIVPIGELLTHEGQEYCSERCAIGLDRVFYKCPVCGKEFVPKINEQDRTFCGKACADSQRHVTSRGVKYIGAVHICSFEDLYGEPEEGVTESMLNPFT